VTFPWIVRRSLYLDVTIVETAQPSLCALHVGKQDHPVTVGATASSYTAGGETESGHTQTKHETYSSVMNALDVTERRMREFMDEMSHAIWAQQHAMSLVTSL
jgi:hypothetical protein